MAGISQILNIAKEALMAHQLSLQVASHNISNVDTPGYTRQSLKLTSVQGAPLAIGTIGGGVDATQVVRHYDQFITQRISSQESQVGYLEAQQQAFRVVETVFNEAQGTGLNDLFSQFWASWQDLAANPDLLAARQAVVQSGEALLGHIQYMDAELDRISGDLSLTLQKGITEVNRLSEELARINIQITGAETTASSANDLRDQRDEIVRSIAEYLGVTNYEGKNGTYTLLLSDGHALVDTAQNWELEWTGDTMYLLTPKADGTTSRQELAAGEELGGKIGGWVSVFQELQNDNQDNYQGRLDSLAASLIREVNSLHSQGVGLAPIADTLTGTEAVPAAVLLSSTVLQSDALQSIAAGMLSINGRSLGAIEGAVAVNGLAMTKASSAVDAVNEAEAGVLARLTTLMAGTAGTGLVAGESVAFSVDGVQVAYTAAADETAAETAANVVSRINTAIAAHNGDPTTLVPLRLEAVVGDGSNGGAAGSIVLRNTMDGDPSGISIAGIDTAADAKLGLANGVQTADATHNTGEIAIFARQAFTVRGGTSDTILNQLGMGGGLHSDDVPGDGEFTFGAENNAVVNGLMGFSYADELAIDGGSLDIWLYNLDNSPAMARPVTVELTGAYTLQDVARAINTAVTGATGATDPWVEASVVQGQLRFTSDGSHRFAFANDTANILQVAGVNTFFSGYDAGSIDINALLSEDLGLLAAGRVGTGGEIFPGDNTNAIQIADLQSSQVSFNGGSTETMDGFYNALVSEVGAGSRSANRDLEFNQLLQSQLEEIRDSSSGVSLDEEMANLIRFQHAYAAAAKLISMSDEMLSSLLDTI